MTTSAPPNDMYWFLRQEVEAVEAELLEDAKQEISQKTLEEGESVDGVYTLFAVSVHAVICEAMMTVLPAGGGFDPIVNWVDAGVSIVQGGRQLLDDESHRPLATKVKGFSNIASGVALTVITGVATTLGTAAAAALSAQGLTAAFAVAFLISCDEVVRLVRKIVDPEYWVMDNIKQWEKLKDKTIPKLIKEISRLDHNQYISRKNSALIWAVERKKERLLQLQELEKELGQDIKDRVTTNETCWMHYKAHFDKGNLSGIAKELIGEKPNFESGEEAAIEEKAALKCKKELKEALSHTLLAGLAFTGMLLLCIPGAQPIGAVLIGVTVAVYVIKYAESAIKNAPVVGDYIKNKLGSKQSEAAGSELAPLLSLRK